MPDAEPANTGVDSLALLEGPTLELRAKYSGGQSRHVHHSLLSKRLPLFPRWNPKTKVVFECSDRILRTLIGWLYYGEFQSEDGVLRALDAVSAWKLGNEYGAVEFRDLAMQQLWDVCLSQTPVESDGCTINTALVEEICGPFFLSCRSKDISDSHLYRFILHALAYLWDCPDGSRVRNGPGDKKDWEDIAKKYPRFYNDLVYLLPLPPSTRKDTLGKVEDYIDTKPPVEEPLARTTSEEDHVDFIGDEEVRPVKRTKVEKSPNIKQEGA